jgi:hypothetical protein
MQYRLRNSLTNIEVTVLEGQVVVQRNYYLTNPCIATLNALDLKIWLRASQQVFCQPVGITMRQYIKQLNKEKHFKKL